VIDAIKGGSFVFSYAAAAAPSVQRASFSPAAPAHPRSRRAASTVVASLRGGRSAARTVAGTTAALALKMR
jgi:hypothetical protein